MDDLKLESRTNAAEYTVSDISNALRRTVEDAFGNVRVRGEISGYRGPHSSGHAYFSLKDDKAKIDAVVWKGTMGRLKFLPEEGMEVIATGKLTTYPGKSNYQIVIDSIEPAGAGALMALLEERKRRLQAEGLFDPARKQLLPYMPRVIGVVTSPTGAVIRDILHRIKDRFPVHVIVWPVRVQGETAAAEVAAAVAGFNRLPPEAGIPAPDLLIVARGGGSLEDLWGFNDEALARAVAASDIPVISAVGHETDWTLIDFAADVRAPTPTGAAEMAVPVKAELDAALAGLAARLNNCISRHIDKKRQAMRAAARALPSADSLLAMPRRKFDEATGRLSRGLMLGTERKRGRLGQVRLAPTMLRRRIEESRRHAERDAQRLFQSLERRSRSSRQDFARVSSRLKPDTLLQRHAQLRAGISTLAKRTDQAESAMLHRLQARLGQATRMLATLKLSDAAILDRGYALVTDAHGAVLRRASAISAGQDLVLTFADGTTHAKAAGIAPDGSGDRRTQRDPKTPAKSDSESRQGKLL